MRISLRQKRLARRMADYAVEPAKEQFRTWLHREQVHDIAGQTVTLPPGHRLPWYQRRDPTYDRYAEGLITALTVEEPTVCVVDLGGNVGDTAVAVLQSAPQSTVISVEGESAFLEYLRRNVAPFGDRVQVVEAFVGPVAGDRTYVKHGTSGGFSVDAAPAADATKWISVADLLAMTPSPGLVIWKSDIDGFDIHLLANHWSSITERCEVLWFEFDPTLTLGDRQEIPVLIDQLSTSGRDVFVYDNLGRRMVRSADPETISTILTGLTEWMGAQVSGHSTVPYLDIWAVDQRIAHRLP